MNELQLERKKLKETLEFIQHYINEEKQNLEILHKEFDGPIEEFWFKEDLKKLNISNLEIAQNNPYFARIDFIEEDGKRNSIYIGKKGISKDGNNIITDWRAPISSLYYDSELGKCSYKAPEGTINGEMKLKRQFEIEAGELLEYFDVDLVSNDALLQKYLNTNNDSRLKSIVSTIQKEQNEVIRKRLLDNLIIQGVAGSGKTTVALHRIAYLVYNYIKTISQNQYLVIGPNPVFIKYIKSVLPELDVSGVSQCTFEEFSKTYINEKIKINPSDKKVNASIAGKINNDVDKFKCSIQYKNMIDKFLESYFNSLILNDLKIGEFTILNNKQIKEVFESTNNVVNTSLHSRVELTIERLAKYIEENNDSILSRYSDYSYKIFENAKDIDEENELRKKFAKERDEIKKNCRTTLRKYFIKSKLSSTKLYKIFINSLNKFNLYNYNHLNELKKITLNNIKKGEYDFEDLAALMYIKNKTSHDRNYNNIKHVVIDEAQDLGEFNFYVLKNVLPTSTFSIFGDLAQSIYDYRAINNWQEVNKVMFDNNGQIINFNKSYRTTSEIMNVADDVASSIGLNRSDLVVRHGNPVSFTKIENENEIPNYISNKIMEYKKKGYKTIAVISKTNLLSNYINDDLSDNGLKIPNISLNDDLSDEKNSVCTISNQLAKGLEFDAVIINNANENIYSSNSSLDMKLLYVAITRALHELDIVYSGELTNPLQDFITKNNETVYRKVK